MNLKLFLILLLSVTLINCAYKKQKVTVMPVPTAQIQCAHNGQGKMFELTVLDEREDAMVGRRGSAYGPAAAIELEGDIKNTFKQSLEEGFKKCGYIPTTGVTNPDPLMRVELRSLNYNTSTGFWSAGVDVKGSAKVIVTKQGLEKFNDMVRVGEEKRVVFVPGAKKNNQWITSVFNELVQKIVSNDLINAALTDLSPVSPVTPLPSAK